ncbi:MAG: cytidylate kinase-like family protein [Clostridiales bacterium]|nr:cytidylate kinase-like family protein [Clostridiales bacterium]
MAVDLKDKKIIITVGREFGSGGRAISRLVSEKLGLPLYDKDLINRAAVESGVDKEVFDNVDEKVNTSLLFSLVRNLEKNRSKYDSHDGSGILSLNERLYLIQKQIIKKIAAEGSCILLGRCSNFTLKNDPNAIHLFIRAPQEFKLQLLKKFRNLEPNAAAKLIKETDKERSNYYKFYTGSKWGMPEDYSYIIDSSVLGTEATADLICDLVEKKLEKNI